MKALIPGTFLVDTFPFLKYVPLWIPGAGFQKNALEWRRQLISMQDTPFAEMKRRMVCFFRGSPELSLIFLKGNGTASPSFCSYSLANIDGQTDSKKQEYDIKSVAGALYVG